MLDAEQKLDRDNWRDYYHRRLGEEELASTTTTHFDLEMLKESYLQQESLLTQRTHGRRLDMMRTKQAFTLITRTKSRCSLTPQATIV